MFLFLFLSLSTTRFIEISPRLSLTKNEKEREKEMSSTLCTSPTAASRSKGGDLDASPSSSVSIFDYTVLDAGKNPYSLSLLQEKIGPYTSRDPNSNSFSGATPTVPSNNENTKSEEEGNIVTIIVNVASE